MRVRYEFSEKWVECLNCSYERVIDLIIDEHDTKGCPICGSHEYEENTPESYHDWETDYD